VGFEPTTSAHKQLLLKAAVLSCTKCKQLLKEKEDSNSCSSYFSSSY
jgi:hypothetical protein